MNDRTPAGLRGGLKLCILSDTLDPRLPSLAVHAGAQLPN